MRTGLYPGTFDPITNGHMDIIARAAQLVDRLVIGVAINEEKKPLFDISERVEMIENELGSLGLETEIQVKPFTCLLMSFAEKCGATLLIRGLRAVADFEYEYQMVGMNRKLNPNVETVFLMAEAQHQSIASRLVKEIARLGGNIEHFVPASTHARVLEKYK